MTTSFPETKEDFTAENGVTYTWEDNRWRVKAYKLDESKLEEYLPLTGGDLSGNLTVRKIREDRNTIAMSILGQVRDNTNTIVNDVLFKSYQREIGSPQSDYVSYYGSGGGANEILNRKTAQSEFASQTAFEELEQAVDDIEIPPAADPIDLDLYLPLAGGTMQGPLHVLTEPQWDDEATSRIYVTNLAATTLTTVWAQNYATETYVDEAIGDIDLGSINSGCLPLTGGTLTGELFFDRGEGGSNLAISPNIGNPETAIVAMNNGALRFRSIPGEDFSVGSNTHLSLGRNDETGEPETFVYHVQDPQQAHWAVNRRYVDVKHASTMKRSGNNDVATGRENEDTVFRIRGIRENGNFFTTMSINSAGMGIYNLVRPTEGHHAATKDYVDSAIADIDLDGGEYLPLSGGTLTDRLFFQRNAAVNMIISPNSGDTSSSIYACNGGALRFRSLAGENVNDSTTHIAIGKEEDGSAATYIYNLHDPEEDQWAANKRYVDQQVQGAIDGFSSSERFYTIVRSSTATAKSVAFYESSGFFYYYIDVVPEIGRVIGAPTNFGFKDVALPFKIGWIQSSGVENIMVSAVAKLCRKTTSGPNHFFQVAIDPNAEDTLIHDPYTVPQGSTVVVTLAGLL